MWKGIEVRVMAAALRFGRGAGKCGEKWSLGRCGRRAAFGKTGTEAVRGDGRV